MMCMHRTVESLVSISIRNICDELHNYVAIKTSSDTIRRLPVPIKELFLRRLTRSSYFLRLFDPLDVFPLLLYKNLSKIDLTFIKVNDKLLDLFEECTELKEIYVSGNEIYYPSSQGLCNFLANKRKLRILHLSHCNSVSDDVIKVIVDTCADLNGLVLRSCMNITDAALINLSTMNNLMWLDFSGTMVSDSGVSMLSTGNSKEKILELRIAYCPKITFRVLTVVVENCTNMEVFEFHNCCQSPDHLQVAALEATKLKRLKQLTFTVSW